MNEIRPFLAQLAAEPPKHEVLFWSGPTPEGAASSPILMSALIDRLKDFSKEPLIALNREDAEIWLALLATHSLLHGGNSPTAQEIAAVREGLSVLGNDAMFFASGQWRVTRRGRHYETLRAVEGWDRRRHSFHFSGAGPLTSGLCAGGGIIGFDPATAFVFWVEEDD